MQVTRAELERIYRDNTIAEALEILDISSANTLYKILRKHGIEKKKPDQNPRRHVDLIIVD